MQFILRKSHMMRFSPRLSVFLMHRWKCKLSKNNTILKLKITALPQKLMIFGGFVNKYNCLHLSYSWHMSRKPKNYKHGLQREMYGGRPKILRTLLGKGLKKSEIKTGYILQFISEVVMWSETRFPTYISNFTSLSMAPLYIMTWNNVLGIFYVLLGRLAFQDSCYLFSNLYISFSYLQLYSRFSRHIISQNHVL